MTHPVTTIIRAAAASFGVHSGAIFSPDRTVRISRARFAAYYTANRLTGLSSVQIGTAFGRDHSTVLHGIDRATALQLEDKDFARRLGATLKIAGAAL